MTGRRQVEVVAHDGTRLSGERVGSGPAVVFANSLAADRTMWAEVIDALEGRVTAIIYDSVGHGRSGPPTGPLTIGSLASHALATAGACGAERFVFCGLSLGGLTGMWLAAHHPGHVAGLLLANTAPVFHPSAMWRDRAAQARAEGMGSFAAPTLDRWLTPGFRVAFAARTERIRRMILATSPEGYAGCCEVLAETDVRPLLPGIACPTRVIAGRIDPSTPPAMAQVIADAIPGAGLTILPAAHLSAVEHPLEFAAEILALTRMSDRREVA